MQKITKTQDVSGQDLTKGDTVTTLNGDLTAKVCDLCEEAGTPFVRLRPLHHPYGRGVWHAADQVLRLAKARLRPSERPIRRPSPYRRARRD
ncbi:MAG: hypothetical protein V3U29_06710 [Phycisphaeraceae bacterium]